MSTLEFMLGDIRRLSDEIKFHEAEAKRLKIELDRLLSELQNLLSELSPEEKNKIVKFLSSL
jgi:hypothetical protein